MLAQSGVFSLCLSCAGSVGCWLAQPFVCLDTGPVVLGLNPWIDLLAWPVLCLWTCSLISGQYLTLITLNCFWPTDCFSGLIWALPNGYEPSCWFALLVEPGHNLCYLSVVGSALLTFLSHLASVFSSLREQLALVRWSFWVQICDEEWQENCYLWQLAHHTLWHDGQMQNEKAKSLKYRHLLEPSLEYWETILYI